MPLRYTVGRANLQELPNPRYVMAMTARLLDVTSENLPCIEAWLRADQARRFWGEPDENGLLLREPSTRTHRALMEADGRKVGLILRQHPSCQELDEAGLTDVPESVVDTDITIGETDATGRGVGPAAIRLVAETALSGPSVPFVIAATVVGRAASLRAFAKAGFRPDREFDDVESGRCVLMARHRQMGQAWKQRRRRSGRPCNRWEYLSVVAG